MPFTMVAWSESQDTAAALTQVAALADQHVTTDGDDILVPSGCDKLLGAFALGATITQGQISSPSLRTKLLVDVSPVNIGAEPLTPTGMTLFKGFEPQLSSSEGLRALVAEGAAGAEQETVLAWLSDGKYEMPQGEVFTVRATSASTLVAYTWTLCPLALTQQLPAGRYAIVGMRATSAGAIAARLVIPGSAWRPGCIAYDAASDAELPVFRSGGLGNWGEFEHTYIPQAEFLSISADTAQVVFLDLVQVRAGAA